jgi:hypothetical protein
MVDIYLVANLLVLSALPSRAAKTALHNTLESIYETHLSNPTIIIPPPHLFDTYSPHSEGIYHFPLNPTHPITSPLPERTSLTYLPTRGELAWNWQGR